MLLEVVYLSSIPSFGRSCQFFWPEGFWVSPYVHFPFILGKALNRKRPDCWDAVKELKLSYCNVGTCSTIGFPDDGSLIRVP